MRNTRATRISRNTSSAQSALGNTRAGLKSSTSCLKPRPERSSASSCAKAPKSLEVDACAKAAALRHVADRLGRTGIPHDRAASTRGADAHHAARGPRLGRAMGVFPDRLPTATSAGVFVYSRAGYGQSSPVPLPRPLTYMHDEALQVLRKLLDAIGFRRGI